VPFENEINFQNDQSQEKESNNFPSIAKKKKKKKLYIFCPSNAQP
jgi:hypothetical protein